MPDRWAGRREPIAASVVASPDSAAVGWRVVRQGVMCVRDLVATSGNWLLAGTLLKGATRALNQMEHREIFATD